MLHFPGWKIALVLFVCVCGLLYAAPNTMPSDGRAWMQEHMPSWGPNKSVNLGLDLQGGAHLLLGIELDEVIADRLQALVGEARRELLNAQPRIGYVGLSVVGDAVSFTLRNGADEDRAMKIARKLDQGLLVDIDSTNRITIKLSEETIAQRRDEVVSQSIEVVRRRIDEMGTREPIIQRQGLDRILVQVPGLGNTGELKEILSTTAKLNFRFVHKSISAEDWRMGRTSPSAELLEAQDEFASHYVIEKEVIVGGETLTDAQPTFSEGSPVVSFSFDTVGGRAFCEATTKNVGRPFAVVLDSVVISAPVIRQAICGGNGIISGSFTPQSSNQLALLMRAGALPAPLTILEERTVGPGLGHDSIEAGKMACVIAGIAVLVFMALTYGLFGLMANIALIFNVALIFGVLSALQATLTLPGIAGIVLTIGMAVDANVLIFERIREEIKAGRSPMSSVDAGYSHALSAIIDANITTLIAALFLFSFGSGPVKGFAVTLGVGVMTSMFTAIMVTRLFVVLWLKRTKPKAIPI